ncbi:MAG: hypothetical protein RLZZ99_601 [Actinomycetota bacterium]
MKKTILGAILAGAMFGSVAIVPVAQAKDKVIVVWADEKRGPGLKKFLEGNKVVPGYDIQIKVYASYDALDGAYQKATAASGPDIMLNPVGDALQYAKSGKVLPLAIPASVRKNMSATALKYATYRDRVYAVPLDIDTTSMIWNNKFGAAPKTFAELIETFEKAKAAGTATVGWCAGDGTWGALPFLTALGGGAYGYVGRTTTPDVNNVLLNTPALIANIKKYALGSDGKSNGLFAWDNCKAAFTSGKALAMNTGSWNLPDVKSAGIKYTILPTPTLDGKGVTRQWAGYGGAWLTTFANDHKVALGARKVMNYLASEEGSLAYALAMERPSPNQAITSKLSDDVQGFAESGSKNGAVQVNALLGETAGGSNYYDVLGTVFKDIFVTGKDVKTTLDAGAAILKANFKVGITKA